MDAFLRAVVERRAAEQEAAVLAMPRSRAGRPRNTELAAAAKASLRDIDTYRCMLCGKLLTKRNIVGICQSNRECRTAAYRANANKHNPPPIPCSKCGRRMRKTSNGLRYYCTARHQE